MKRKWLGGARSHNALQEDALQESFVKLWGRYAFHSSQEAEAVLARTVRNTSVDAYRRQKTVPLTSDYEDEESGHRDEEKLFQTVESLVNERLSDIQRYIIRRHHYEGASLKLIAKELGMKEPAVRMQLSRARKTIRERYHEQELL